MLGDDFAVGVETRVPLGEWPVALQAEGMRSSTPDRRVAQNGANGIILAAPFPSVHSALLDEPEEGS